MNEKAEEIGCTNTHFVNANGMHDDNHYTTAKDLALISEYAMKDETIREIVKTIKYTLPNTELYTGEPRVLDNTNLLIHPENKYYLDYVIGVKTGYTKEAGNCLVSYTEKNDISFICVTLKAGSTSDKSSLRFQDQNDLLEYGYNSFSYRDIVVPNTVVSTIQVKGATDETKMLNLVTADHVVDFISNDIDLDELESKIEIYENIQAPVKKGDVLGKIVYKIYDKEYISEIVAENDVEAKIITKITNNINKNIIPYSSILWIVRNIINTNCNSYIVVKKIKILTICKDLLVAGVRLELTTFGL